ncbi:hypothetical protein B0A50_02361 [Salinomyces thailandicus]|uniref:Uncharacterized protein n=1 Tax=Salinomyces thailandicus TaxID=706561 RepID=A0A4U0U639_9PEZI|nr:hypothetical protein B0A50_02361 [Salinomyces thailandica]
MRATDHGSMTTTESNNSLPKRTLIILFWALSTLLWSLFLPQYKTLAARVSLLQPAWILRGVKKDPSWTQDLALFLAVHAIDTHRAGIWKFPSYNDLARYDFDDPTFQTSLQTFSLLGMCALLAGSIVLRDRHLKSTESIIEPGHDRRIDDQVLPPLLLASKTTHTRLVPKKHSFEYSYLLVGVPVGMRGRISSMLSVDSQYPGWFVVGPDDYLHRGSAQQSLAEKLKSYLHTQGVTDRDYAFAYLVTAPRFLNYSFNPVSFWYLYDSDVALKYMILEVNNTFGERRIYLLGADNSKGDPESDTLQGKESDAGDGKQLVFSESWPKDFHVSPFNSRKGTYSLRATNPLATYEESGEVRIDNTIVLSSSDGEPKIVARIFSQGAPKDPATISSFEAAKFIARWCWVGFATFPRIIKEAFKLFFQRKLHVWYRPEVTVTSLGRDYTDDEKTLEVFFRAFITHAVNEASTALRVVYTPAHHEGAGVVLYSAGFTFEEDQKRTLSIKVTSPAFYSRFVQYASAREAFECECLAVDERARTGYLEQPELLSVLLTAIEEQDLSSQPPSMKSSSLDRLRWSCLTRSRRPPAPTTSPTITPNQQHRKPRPTEIDRYVRNYSRDPELYRRIAIRLFLAERFALGFPALLTVLDGGFRAALLLAAVRHCYQSEAFDSLGRKSHGVGDVGAVVSMLLWANAVHVWSFLKG